MPLASNLSVHFEEQRCIYDRKCGLKTLHIHKDLVDQLSLVDIGFDFVSASEHRKDGLGTFPSLRLKSFFSMTRYTLLCVHLFYLTDLNINVIKLLWWV